VTHMHLASCAVFEGPPPGYDDVCALIAARLAPWRGYRQRLRHAGGHLGRPVWVDDESFDLANHVHRCTVPPPGHEDELNDLMGRLMSVELDRRRPLWDVWMVDGLAERRWALIAKIHHCLLDGIAGAELLARLLDIEPHPHPTSLRPAEPTGPDTGGGGPTASGRRHPIRNDAGRPKAQSVRFAHPHAITSAVHDTVTGAVDLGRKLRPKARLSIHGQIGPQRRWAVARSTLDDLAAVQAVFGGTVNDVALAALSGAFRDLLIARGDRIEDAALRSLVPVSLRRAGDHTADNQLAALIVELPIGIADPTERLVVMRYAMNHVKASHQIEAMETMTTLVGLTAPTLLALGVRSVTSILRHVPQRSVETVTTNVPGPHMPLYALGREMLECLPYVPITQGIRIGVAVISYNGQLRFGVTGDHDTVPEMAWFCRRIEAGITELRQRAQAAGRPVPRPPTG
jgi:diacylglycerol O-acyltransferase